MKTYTADELKEVLAQHKLWLESGYEQGVRADLSGADLTYVNLRRANLSGADLTYANLTYANLSRANLSGANLRGADLSGADLSGANLTYANLSKADLRDANLTYANLRDANLTYANLSGADLSGADLSGANLRDVGSLNGVVGNMSQIKSVQVDGWAVAYTATHMQIGCQLHTLDSWWAFSDSEISGMDDDALAWWATWKPILASIVEASPAEPGAIA